MRIRRVKLATVLIVLVATLVVFPTGCGGDGDNGNEVQVQKRTEVSLDEDQGTKEPSGIGVLDELPQLERASADETVPAIRGSAGLTVPQWLSRVNGDVAAYWQSEFNEPDYTFPAPFQQIFDRPVTTRCGGRVPAKAGPFYCELDDTIFLPSRFFTREAQRFGDAAVAVIVAHENGHHVQDVLKIFDQKGLKTIQTELQADCLAGVWAASILRRGLLELGDIGEILGEVEISGDPPGTPVTAPGAHGSSELRQVAFFRGYDGGRPGACPIPPVPGH
jgi:uncharacterized protein